jgi:tetratricopeptide (TPR) repeat protein/SAM-dependent methyltransferase
MKRTEPNTFTNPVDLDNVDIHDKFTNALSHHRLGRLSEAKQFYKETLIIDPNHADSLQLLGVVALQMGDPNLAVRLINRAIQINPGSEIYYNNLGVSFKSLDRFEEAIKNYRKAISIMPTYADAYNNLGIIYKEKGQAVKAVQFFHQAIEMNTGHFLAHKNLQETFKEFDVSPLTFNNSIQFLRFSSHSGGQVLTGISLDKRYFLKIELIHHPLKANTLDKEAEIIKFLNSKGCISCPQHISNGTISSEELNPWLDEKQVKIVEVSGQETFPYILEQYIEACTGTLPDMLLSLIEQKNLGVYHGDLKPDNLKFDPQSGVCYLIDYDQAEFLDKKRIGLSNIDFFKWCDQRAHEKYNFNSFLKYFQNIDYFRHVLPLFRDEAFNLGATTLYKKQQTTLASCGIYHSIRENSIFADGERDISERVKLLDKINLKQSEKILDIGCNSGLLSRYLHDRGCDVTGIDLDSSIIVAAKMITNILQKNIKFECRDIDVEGITGEYDTVMLFSVLHHTRNMVVNAGLIAKACKRIIIECRLSEDGAKPEENGWSKTSAWNYPNTEIMIEKLEEMFPGFKMMKNHGKADRERYVLEFYKIN